MPPPDSRSHQFLRFLERYARTDMRYFVASGFWGNLSTLSVTLFSLALYLVFARYLPREAFGTYQYLLSISAVLGALTLTGINTAVTNAVARGEDGALVRAVRFQLRWSFVPFAAALCLSLYYFASGNAVLGTGTLIVGALTPLINAWNTYSAFLLGKQDFRRVFLYNFAINIPFYALLIGAALGTDSPLLLIGANLLVQAIGYGVAYRATLSVYRPRPSAEAGDVERYGAHLSVMGGLGVLALQADAVLAFHFLGATGLAVYAFAVAVPERLGGLVKFLPSAALPKFANRPFEEGRAGLFRKFPLAIVGLLLIAAAYAYAAPYLFTLLFPTYMDAVPYSQWYALAILGVVTQLFVTLLSAHKAVRKLYSFNVLSPVMQLGLQVAGILLFGLAGLIAGRLLGMLFALTLALFLVLLPMRAGTR